MTSAGRPSVSFLAWAPVSGRSSDIADALGGEARCWYPLGLAGKSTILRYLVSAVLEVWYLVRRRPRAVIATNPPVFCGLIAHIYATVARVPFVLDSHPTAFGAKDNRVAQRLLPLSRWLSRRAASTLVTTAAWVRTVEDWGGSATIVHEPPAGLTPPEARRANRTRPRVLFVGIFASDEPVEQVVEAARSLPDIDLQVTGRVERAPAGLMEHAPSNVEFVGYLDPAAYRAALQHADVVVSLTTEPTSVMRSAYEAVYAGRPLVVSNWPVLHEVFPEAIKADGDADSIADGITAALTVDASRSERARALQLERWSHQLRELTALIEL